MFNRGTALVLNSVTGRLTGDIQRVDEPLPVNWVINRKTVYPADGGAHGRSPTCQGATINGVLPGLRVTRYSASWMKEGELRRHPPQSACEHCVRVGRDWLNARSA